MSAGLAFMEQNDAFAEAVTGPYAEDNLEAIYDHAEHHAGGLYVLARTIESKGQLYYVKAHDTWGDEGDDVMVVHVYRDEELEAVELFTNPHLALERFLNVELVDVKWGTYAPYEGEES